MMEVATQQPLTEMESAEEIFQEGAELLLTLEAEKAPLKFNTRIAFFNSQRIELNMPDRWWKLIPIEESMPVSMAVFHRGGMYILHGTIAKMQPGRAPGLIIRHADKVKRSQRRMFFRVRMEKPFLIEKTILPLRECLRNIPATLCDISAGGIGFKSSVFLPQGSRLRTRDLFDAMFKDQAGRVARLEVMWCRVQRPLGYRVGAGFVHATPRDQDAVAQIVNQLQRIQLSRTYHIVGDDQQW